MFWDDEGFGDQWDLGGFILEDLITFPIKQFIHGELRKQGIDPNNWRRRGAALTASAVGAFIGSIAGGPVGILIGLMGYITAVSAKYKDSEEGNKRKLEESLALTAGGIACEALKAHVSNNTWDRISDEVQMTVQRYRASNPSVDRTISLIHDAIARVDGNCADQWLSVYKTAARAAGI